MTYQERLDQLQLIAIKQSDALLQVVKEGGHIERPDFQKAKSEWESACTEHAELLNKMEAEGLRPEDRVRHALPLHMRISSIISIFF